MRFSIALLIAMTTGFAMADQKVEWIAHRGESYLAPENTMASYNLAWKLNDDANETDIQLTKDGKVIICHDVDTNRTTGTKLLIKDANFDDLRGLDAGSWKDPKFAGEKLPTLKEFLDSIPKGKKVYVEIKSGIDVVPQMLKDIAASGKTKDEIVLISFKEDALAAAKKALPDFRCYYLSGFKQDKQTKEWQPKIDDLIKVARKNGFEGLDLQDKPPFDGDAIKQIKAAGLGAYVWTVDDPAVAKQYIQWGIQGITTNRAAWLKTQCEATASATQK